ncbi:MAG: NUDIX hydrolase, partial [Nitrospirae bacterium]|nr:NUDIX hydrolase [Nitrospirota bacterium]
VTITGLVGVYSYPGYPVVIIVYKAEGNGDRPSVGDETLEVGLFGPDEIPWDDLAFPSTVQALRDYFSRREDG